MEVMEKKVNISIARDFSRVPAGRYLTDGPYSGERFRDEQLIPALGSAEMVEIDLDGARGYGSSFLEEAFGGLLRKTRLSFATVKPRLHFISEEDPTLIDEIMEYMEDEAKRSK
ncbi:hypothetical protein NH8B_1950 [Pseudogulbenkiania sp. NH8B]|uniref:STAS-like domain-containing protein n=1 Tax=Pseudogulbenkiania sp. (strain NH8B) TaxID=748280 RepID=UPI0002279FEB|nr:STAS-like domain-containing protein [Pseudogulbenkiania sp. NH8B]BAK76765.1 hypothetical protein NH8B_1950 [Pseudogulbenkiania sp. NH8B]